MNIGFRIYDFCCRLNIINSPGEYYDRKYIKSSIVVNENEYIHKLSFHLGYRNCFNNLSIKNMITLSDHSKWMGISAITPYSNLCSKKKG